MLTTVGHWLLVLAWLSCVYSALVNITVDDYYRDPLTNTSWVTYTPSASWKLSLGTPCDNCTARPDASHVYYLTWHEGVYDADGVPNMDASLNFEGVAVYVYCIIPRSTSSPDGNVDMQFFLDGQEVGSYSRPPNGTDTYEYDVPVYVNKSLSAGNHVIELHNGKVGGNQSTVLLDYITYTRDTAVEPVPSNFTEPIWPPGSGGLSPQLHSAENANIIPIAIGCSVGFIAAVIIAAIVWPRLSSLLKRRRRLPPSAQYLQSVGGDGDRGESGWVADAPASTGAAAVSTTGLVERTASTPESGGTPQAGPGPSTLAARNAGAPGVEEVAR
ncbi:hypothetical protein K466DRAFT_168582 [Polyporus arcularius HHB13444]|uniref:Uncharacterized protein n=1 Tax=Polyporus arcularius HHB13444 TaxID=1314778 RepID=A0A5C3PW62_9APHY|nr:hypothetical protein K466DRAFT_168582 [Polyporus arcularius HHB13444]